MRMRFFALIVGIGTVLCFGGCGKAQEYFVNGQEAFRLGQYEDALMYFTKAAEENPDKAEYYIEQGHTYAALRQYEEARKALEHAVVEQNLELTRKNNKRAWRAIGITYYEEKDYDNAKLYFEKALAESMLPELDADIRMYLADTLECEGDYEAAIAVYDTLLSERKEYAAGYRARAYMSYVLGAYEESLADYDAAILLEPKNFDLYFGKYNVLGKLGKTSEQLELLGQITKIENPTSEDLYFIAKAQYFSGEYDTALDGLMTAAESGYEDSYFYAGEICRMRNDYGQAIHNYERYIEGSGAKDAAAYNQMAICQLRQERLSEALETVLAGQKLSDTLHGKQLLFNEVVILEKMGNYNTAYERAAAYIRQYPEDEKMQEELRFLSTRVREES
ncbi:MAG: tetratricopeptide repeat protein [Lachnospiraceae bacterium]|nr:tetratricopeptide repeat protein [Lachnospiraceae bacterium]